MKLIILSFLLCSAAHAELVSSDTNNSNFVNMLYHVLLNRAADFQSLLDWTTQLNNKTITRAKLELAIRNSPEYQVRMEYLTVLGRTPDAAGQQFWINKMTTYGWTRQQVHQGFMNSAEYQNRAAPKGSCILQVQSCPLYPSLVATFNDSYNNSNSNALACMQRAQDYYNFCGTKEPVRAAYSAYGSAVQQTVYGNSCHVAIKTCPNHPQYANGYFSDFYNNSNNNSGTCIARSVDYNSWCGTTDAVTAAYHNNGVLQIMKTYPYPSLRATTTMTKVLTMPQKAAVAPDPNVLNAIYWTPTRTAGNLANMAANTMLSRLTGITVASPVTNAMNFATVIRGNNAASVGLAQGSITASLVDATLSSVAPVAVRLIPRVLGGPLSASFSAGTLVGTIAYNMTPVLRNGELDPVFRYLGDHGIGYRAPITLPSNIPMQTIYSYANPYSGQIASVSTAVTFPDGHTEVSTTQTPVDANGNPLDATTTSTDPTVIDNNATTDSTYENNSDTIVTEAPDLSGGGGSSIVPVSDLAVDFF